MFPGNVGGISLSSMSGEQYSTDNDQRCQTPCKEQFRPAPKANIKGAVAIF